MKSSAAVILAAGYSSRAQQFKPLLKIGNETVVDRVISLFFNNSNDVFLVTGWRQDELISNLHYSDIRIVQNPDYAGGMFTSIKAGIRALKPYHERFFIMPVDIPLVRPFTIKYLEECSLLAPGKIVYPIFRGQRGHPPLIPISLVSEILNSPDNEGLKIILDAHEKDSLDIAVPDQYIHCDMDTPEDYNLILKRYSDYETPTTEEAEIIRRDIIRILPAIRKHCDKVAEIAQIIGNRLQKKGFKLNLGLIVAASLLHDIAKGQPNHEAAGAALLSSMGFGRIGDVVARHTDLPEAADVSLEDKIVYLSDKLVIEDQIVFLEERFQTTEQRFAGNPEAKAQIARRRQQALSIQSELENILGDSLNSII